MFTTAAFRLHSTLATNLPVKFANGSLDLRVQFPPIGGIFTPPGHLAFAGQTGGPISAGFLYLASGALEGTDSSSANLARGMAFTHAKRMDNDITSAMTFIPAGLGGIDIKASNLHRCNVMGCARYYDVRLARMGQFLGKIYGRKDCKNVDENSPSPDPVGCFYAITKDMDDALELQSIYGKITKIDPFVGMLAEKKRGHGTLGTVHRLVIEDQFRRLRDGDRLWYENTMSLLERLQVRKVSMHDVLVKAFGDIGLQEEVFEVPDPEFFEQC
jgi:hypothetical protein